MGLSGLYAADETIIVGKKLQKSNEKEPNGNVNRDLLSIPESNGLIPAKNKNEMKTTNLADSGVSVGILKTCTYKHIYGAFTRSR